MEATRKFSGYLDGVPHPRSTKAITPGVYQTSPSEWLDGNKQKDTLTVSVSAIRNSHFAYIHL